MSGGKANKPAYKFWHQGFAVSKDVLGRPCVRFQTYGIAIKVAFKAGQHGFRLAVYQDDGNWCLRLLAKGESP